ncbi:MAG: 1-acyl-sn-glycerol-3-phosphate acyltransferase [Rhizobiaceae bacterium]|nr:1-acyl-sn-glycerol-3-phosphate acyltransferase [Rhizobiaceae bacterium]
MIALRSLLFTALFYLNLAGHMILFGPFVLFGPDSVIWWVTKSWARTSLWLMRVVTGTKAAIGGQENIPKGPAIIAAKHQAFWEVFALVPELERPTFVLKKELMAIPLFGWYSRRLGMIPVDRTKGASAMHSILGGAQTALDAGRQIIIFPEGTRTAPGVAADYHPGVYFLYSKLDAPLVPVALNSGVYWPRDSFVRRPGTVLAEFLPAIPPGLKRHDLIRALKETIEGRSLDMLRQAYRERRDLPMNDVIAELLREAA